MGLNLSYKKEGKNSNVRILPFGKFENFGKRTVLYTDTDWKK